MEYQKKNTKIYCYTCTECGNEFEKNHPANPYECHECHTSNSFEMEVKDVEIIEQYCPICKSYFRTSEYLNNEIANEHARWIANMVTHSRHNHLESWNKMWGRNGHYYRQGWDYSEYDENKKTINERIKRQILRKCKDYMIENGFNADHVKQLAETDEKTIKLYEKILGAQIPEKTI